MERYTYIHYMFPDADEVTIKQYVKYTEGLSIAEIKNRVIEMRILGKPMAMEGNGFSREIHAEEGESRRGRF
jgi:hypothetical protein